MKILIIDDSNMSRQLFKKALGEEHEYIEVADGMSGLERYFLEKPDLVVLDLTMPGMDGMEVLNQLKKIDPNVRVIVGTADVQDASRLEAEKLGAAGFVLKPFTPEDVKQAVNEAMSKEG
jgi:two-component system chemotaxis response regulator CheY